MSTTDPSNGRSPRRSRVRPAIWILLALAASAAPWMIMALDLFTS